MKEYRIPHESNGTYRIFTSPDLEYVNPIEYYADCFTEPRISIERDLLLAKKLPYPRQVIEGALRHRAENAWKEKYDEINKLVVPPNFIALLKSESKKDQVKLLREQSLTIDQLMAFIIKAWTDFGYTFSQFSRQHLHNGLENEIIPKVIVVDGEGVDKVGATTLSDGQLKHLIKHRKKIVAKFIDKGENWHCLFFTFKSLSGEENWKDGQPHFHYISDKFGIKREDVVSQLKEKYYSLGSLPHIDIIK